MHTMQKAVIQVMIRSMIRGMIEDGESTPPASNEFPYTFPLTLG